VAIAHDVAEHGVKMIEFTADQLAKWEKDNQIKQIKLIRARLRNTPGHIHDFPGNPGKFDDQLVESALNGSKSHKNCLILCDLAYSHGRNGVVELGTNLGISSTYLAIGARSKNARSTIATGDCSGKRLNIAKSVHQECGFDDIVYIEGLFENTADNIFEAVPNWSFAFIDGDHTYDGTMRYYEIARSTGVAGNCVVFDDVDWSDGMKEAWKEISRKHPFTSHKIGDMGLIIL